jgi:hypothetical protein
MSEVGPTPAPNRRLFRFSLRTWIIAFTLVALSLGWIKHNLNQINQRRALVSYVRRGAGFGGPLAPRGRVPLLWRLMGIEPMISDIELPRHIFSVAEQEWLQAVYPESKVVFVDRAPVNRPSTDELDWAEKHWDDATPP